MPTEAFAGLIEVGKGSHKNTRVGSLETSWIPVTKGGQALVGEGGILFRGGRPALEQCS